MQEERRVAAWIGASVVVQGDVTSSEDMTIAGQVEGDVAVPSHALVVARQARIRGDIVAREVVIQGHVTGSVTAEERLEIADTGTIDGDLRAPRLVVSEGAVLHGRLEGGGSGRTRGTGPSSPANEATATPTS